MATILKILKYEKQLQIDLRYENTIPNYAIRSIFRGDDVFYDVTEWPQSWFYIHVSGRFAPGASCKGNVPLINVSIVIVFLGYTCLKNI